MNARTLTLALTFVLGWLGFGAATAHAQGAGLCTAGDSPPPGLTCGWHIATSCANGCSPADMLRKPGGDPGCAQACSDCCDDWGGKDQEIVAFGAGKFCDCMIASYGPGGSGIACVGEFTESFLLGLGVGKEWAEFAQFMVDVISLGATFADFRSAGHWGDIPPVGSTDWNTLQYYNRGSRFRTGDGPDVRGGVGRDGRVENRDPMPNGANQLEYWREYDRMWQERVVDAGNQRIRQQQWDAWRAIEWAASHLTEMLDMCHHAENGAGALVTSACKADCESRFNEPREGTRVPTGPADDDPYEPPLDDNGVPIGWNPPDTFGSCQIIPIWVPGTVVTSSDASGDTVSTSPGYYTTEERCAAVDSGGNLAPCSCDPSDYVCQHQHSCWE